MASFLFGSISKLIKNSWGSRFLIKNLLLRDLVASNKRALLKYSWILLSPFIGALSWVLMNVAGVLMPGESGAPYPIYILTGVSVWSFWIALANTAAATLTDGTGFISKINYHHEVIFVKNLIIQLIYFSISTSINVVVISLFWQNVLLNVPFFILSLFPLILFAGGVGLLLSLFSVIATDIRSIFSTGANFLIYLTPVLFVGVNNERIQWVIHANPLTYLVSSPRSILLFGKLEYAQEFLLCSLGSVLFFLFSLNVFYNVEKKLIERMP